MTEVGNIGDYLNLLYIQLAVWYYIYVSYEELVVNLGSFFVRCAFVANENEGW
jgi:hypothetical protein